MRFLERHFEITGLLNEKAAYVILKIENAVRIEV